MQLIDFFDEGTCDYCSKPKKDVVHVRLDNGIEKFFCFLDLKKILKSRLLSKPKEKV